jgi:hypothetical protein
MVSAGMEDQHRLFDALSYCDRANDANESIHNPRRRTKTAPKERSIRFPWLNLTCAEEAGVTFVTVASLSSLRQIIEAGEVGSLSKIDRFSLCVFMDFAGAAEAGKSL